MSVTLTLEDEIDLSRGDMLVSPERAAARFAPFRGHGGVVQCRAAGARDEITCSSTTCARSRAKATKIRYRVNMKTLEQEPARELKMNDIAEVEFETVSPLFFDPVHATASPAASS